ncbi:MAG: hypothetical protein VXA26_10715, partial [Candidatus Neomarinimicrobiota bacterium]
NDQVDFSGTNANVVDIFTNEIGGFVGLKNDGTIITWGSILYGGDLTYNSTGYNSITGTNENIVEIIPASSSFAALKSDGTFVTWGQSATG